MFLTMMTLLTSSTSDLLDLLSLPSLFLNGLNLHPKATQFLFTCTAILSKMDSFHLSPCILESISTTSLQTQSSLICDGILYAISHDPHPPLKKHICKELVL